MWMKEIWNEKADGQENLWYKGLFLYKPFLGASIACILVSWDLFKKYWTLDVNFTASYEITLVRLSVRD